MPLLSNCDGAADRRWLFLMDQSDSCALAVENLLDTSPNLPKFVIPSLNEKRRER